MSEDEQRGLKNEEPKDEADVEAHHKRFKANDEGQTEGEGDDDFEAHRYSAKKPKNVS